MNTLHRSCSPVTGVRDFESLYQVVTDVTHVDFSFSLNSGGGWATRLVGLPERTSKVSIQLHYTAEHIFSSIAFDREFDLDYLAWLGP